MKVLGFVSLCVLLMSISCRKSEIEDLEKKPSIVGVWYQTQYQIFNNSTNIPETEIVIYSVCQQNTFLEMKKDNTSVSKVYAEGNISNTGCVLLFESFGTYTFDGKDKILFYNNGLESESKILELTENSIILKYQYLSQSGGIEHMVYKVTNYRKKNF
jgi:hypothetical protein